ncbi:DNA-3-methyladenine glycosylase [Virgibacillus oceani]|uniref:Putative 3-methyladenine DNA glycosylase n=1 Tax=Virgibacillus oceani TaxID=1479511 RepID=A0A917H535_9BACI|nr:DNA-3-methyladenine glycosylase [Virgibacillus oceani]GGG67912.1 putative 3-methyladenine DNA glycosylase [Virgibacillus oceani]
MCNITDKPLDKKFYYQPTLELAKALLGCLLIKETPNGITSGIIVETEAYMGPADRAAHSFNNRRTMRTEIMYGNPGHAYTYSMHTHCLLNVVSGKTDEPEAVLIRGVEPYTGQNLMASRRPKAKNERQWTNGPGKLTKALGITMADYGHPLTESPLWIMEGRKIEATQIVSGPRIGIDNTGEARDYPWRFWLKGNKYVSK